MILKVVEPSYLCETVAFTYDRRALELVRVRKTGSCTFTRKLKLSEVSECPLHFVWVGWTGQQQNREKENFGGLIFTIAMQRQCCLGRLCQIEV